MSTSDLASGNPPLVTIGITCFDAENTIKRAIDCACHQDWPNFEIIVVDDASTDNSPDIIQGTSKTDGRIRYIRHTTNRGYPGALNSILEAANGDFVAFFDDDDESLPGRVSQQFDRLTRYSEATGTDRVFCYTNRKVVYEEAENKRPGFVPAIGRTPAEPRGSAVAEFLLWHRQDPAFVWGQFGSCTLMARLNTLVDAGGFDESFRRGAEWDLAIRLALAGGHFIAVDEPLVTQHVTSTQDKAGNLPLKYLIRLREKHKVYLKSRRLLRASIAIAHARFHYARQKKLRSLFYLTLACLCSPFTVLPSEFEKWKHRQQTDD